MMSNMMGGGDGHMMLNGGQSEFVEVKEESVQGSVEGEPHLKKGPWTAAEDAILLAYVNKHGEGNWNTVQKNSGLARCGKSCRLRWANHLRPNLKKGAFTEEEEKLIAKLHSQWGNKWAQMASKLPGRTDNEIKNYWNTRVKRLNRAGLPLYPPDVEQQRHYQENPNVGSSISTANQRNDIPQDGLFSMPELNFKNLKHHAYLPFDILDGRDSSQFQHTVNQSYGDLVLLGNSHEEPNMLYNGLDHGSGYLISGLDKFKNYPAKPPLPLMSSLSNSSLEAMNVFHGVDPLGSHATSNGTLPPSLSVSKAPMSELPSFQYLAVSQVSWDINPPPLSSLKSVNTVLDVSPVRYQQSCSVTPHSGFCELEPCSTNFPKVSDNHNSWASNNCMTVDMYESELECDPHGDIMSTISHPCITVNDLDFIEQTFGPAPRREANSQYQLPVSNGQETPSRIDISMRPDALLDSYYSSSHNSYM